MNISPAAIFGAVASALWIVIAIAASVPLLLAYGRTKMSSLLWLFGAVIVWPTVARLTSFSLGVAAPGLAAERALPFGSVSNMLFAVALLETLIGGILLVVALVLLGSECQARLASQVHPAAPAIPPPNAGS